MSAQGLSVQGLDANRNAGASTPDVPNSTITLLEVPANLRPADPDPDGDDRAPRGRPVVAIATMPAPANSFDITVTLTNLAQNAITGGQGLRAVTLDCHRALRRQSLTIEEVLGVAAPPDGTATIRSGNAGPAVVSFTGFGFRESALMGLDPDSWEDPNFGVTRADMAGCRVEVVFFGTLRGAGVMEVLRNGSVRATIRQIQN
jgi:hypothetical protein